MSYCDSHKEVEAHLVRLDDDIKEAKAMARDTNKRVREVEKAQGELSGSSKVFISLICGAIGAACAAITALIIALIK